MKTYSAIGLMSGSSLDGLDIAHILFTQTEGKWSFQLRECTTFPYTKEWQAKLCEASKGNALEISLLDIEYGFLCGEILQQFISKHSIQALFVASHGHTIFHQPDKFLSLQIGSGSAMAARCGLPIINQFRNNDVCLGGQGAPLVPIGDALLFQEYDYCINLGGFANISYQEKGKRLAFDICPCNLPLNKMAIQLGSAYDKNGNFARSGKLIPKLLSALNALDYYRLQGAKSLGKEYLDKEFYPILNSFKKEDTHHLLATLCEHIATQISLVCTISPQKKVLLSGGGALNTYLTERIASLCGFTYQAADEKIIHYKEALIFGFLGLLRYLEIPNCLQSVTGACTDNIGGAIYLPPPSKF